MNRVLIVDDQPAFRRQLRRLLTHAGLTVVGEASSVAQAEPLALTLQPDLVVIDVMLPGISGIAGTRRLRALAPGLRVIVVSAHRDRADLFQTAAQEAGAEAFVAKDDLSVSLARGWAETTPAPHRRQEEDSP